MHCNLKPRAIWFVQDHPALAGFSLVCRSGRPVTDVVFGTPGYMSPEQTLVGYPFDGRSDIYSLGCVLYEMLAGHPPFGDRTVADLIEAHQRRPPPPLRPLRGEVSEPLQDIVCKMLAKDPGARFQSADALLGALVAA